ncbi:MAG: penicillin-binding transpeptidase domain-containing protein [Halieaceae bacterium]|nr:penicillin-binding transpeptidase domain-containing protein [Halieaceae bacterium]
MATFITLLFGLLVWRVLSLQVLDSDRGYAFLQDQGEARYVRSAEIPAYRGIISDRRGEPLAVSTPVISLWANPRQLAGSGRVTELESALGLKSGALEERLENYAAREFMYLERHMTPPAARAVLRRKIPGVGGHREYQRYYPAGEVVAHVVGMTDVDDRGIEGMELAFEDWLKGAAGRKQVIKDLHGEVVRDIGELRAAQPGRDLQLSVDLRLQYLAHRELQRAIATSGARAGTVVTLDSRSGEVLALVNYPTYNPNGRGSLKAGSTRNRALTDVFEPGSTMKPLTLVAALESGLYAPDTIIDTSPGRVQVGSKVLLDPVNYGELSVARVVAKSSQVGIVKMALNLDEQAVWQTFTRFGLGENPGTGFPGESAGVLPYRDRWRDIERVTLAYGYGLAVTPLQLARAYSVIANDGKLVTPSLLRLDGAGAVDARQVVEPRIARQVLDVLHGVTSEDGTARSAQVEGYGVAGKTGTAHKVGRDGYADDRYLAFFAGIAPVRNPRLVTVVLIDEPKGDRYYGGEVAAPVFSRITEGALRMLNVIPDQVTGDVASQGRRAGGEA